jgi:hypothetical protein
MGKGNTWYLYAWGESDSYQGIANRIHTVNKDFGVNKKGRPETFVPKPKIKSLLLKVDLDELDEEFLKEGF